MLCYGNERMRELRMARVENGESPSEGCTENQLHYVVLTQVGFSAGRSRPVRLLLAAAWWPSAAVSTWLVRSMLSPHLSSVMFIVGLVHRTNRGIRCRQSSHKAPFAARELNWTPVLNTCRPVPTWVTTSGGLPIRQNRQLPKARQGAVARPIHCEFF